MIITDSYIFSDGILIMLLSKNHMCTKMNQEHLEHMTARDIMTPEVYMLPIDASLCDVVDLMCGKNVSACFFKNLDTEEYFIITHTDMLNFLNDQKGPVPDLDEIKAIDIMNGPVKIVSQDMSIDKAIRFLQQHKYKRTLVGSNSNAIGVLSIRDILEWTNHYFPVGKPQVLLFIDNESGIMLGKYFFDENLDADIDTELMDLIGGALQSIEHITSEIMGIKNKLKNMVGEKHAILFEVFHEITGILICDRKCMELHQKLHAAIQEFYLRYEQELKGRTLKSEIDIDKIAAFFTKIREK